MLKVAVTEGMLQEFKQRKIFSHALCKLSADLTELNEIY